MKVIEVKMQNTLTAEQNNVGYIAELEEKLEQERDNLDLKKKELSNLKRNAVNSDSEMLLEKISRLEEKLQNSKRENKELTEAIEGGDSNVSPKKRFGKSHTTYEDSPNPSMSRQTTHDGGVNEDPDLLESELQQMMSKDGSKGDQKFSQDFLKIFQKYKEAITAAMSKNMMKMTHITNENNKLKGIIMRDKNKDNEIVRLKSEYAQLEEDFNKLNEYVKSTNNDNQLAAANADKSYLESYQHNLMFCFRECLKKSKKKNNELDSA